MPQASPQSNIDSSQSKILILRVRGGPELSNRRAVTLIIKKSLVYATKWFFDLVFFVVLTSRNIKGRCLIVFIARGANTVKSKF